jgi:hypothetical protein
VLPVVRALVNGYRRADLQRIGVGGVEVAIDAGLGAAVAYVTADAPDAPPRAVAIQAAHLVSKLLTEDILLATEEVLRRAHEEGCRPLLLKGLSTALRYYPAPHLRTMGDVDLLVPRAQQHSLESVLHRLGYVQPRDSAGLYEGHHHSKPFRHPESGVCFEVHTGLYPPTSPLAGRSHLAEGLVRSPASIPLGAVSALVMDDESQLIYTSTRWAEVMRARRGIFGLLDVALLLRERGATLDWDRVCTSVQGSWAATALHLVLSYLNRWELAASPERVLDRLAPPKGPGASLRLKAVHRLITTFTMEHRAAGNVLTPRNLQTTWATLTGPGPAWLNLAAVPYRIVFPPGDTDRFDLKRAARRLRTLFRPS